MTTAINSEVAARERVHLQNYEEIIAWRKRLDSAESVYEMLVALDNIDMRGGPVDGLAPRQIIQTILDVQRILIPTTTDSMFAEKIELIPHLGIRTKCKAWLNAALSCIRVYSKVDVSSVEIIDALEKLAKMRYENITVLKKGERQSIEVFKTKDVVKRIQAVVEAMSKYAKGKLESIYYKMEIDRLILQVPSANNFDLKVYYEAMEKIDNRVSKMPPGLMPPTIRERFRLYLAYRMQR